MNLLVCDIDNTLYWYNNQNNAGVSEECRKAIKKWVDAGNIFAVATARVHTMRDYTLNDLGFKVDYLGGNGAEIIYRDGTQEFYTLPVSYFIEVGKWIDKRKYDASVKICINNQFISYRQDLYPYTYLQRMRKNLKSSIVFSNLGLNIGADVGVNMSVISHPKLTRKIETELKKRFECRCEVIATDYDNIDFMPLNVGKDKAILRLANRYRISIENIVVVGDAKNDICMFELTKNSYCMSHSNLEIQAKASRVINSVEEVIELELNKRSTI